MDTPFAAEPGAYPDDLVVRVGEPAFAPEDYPALLGSHGRYVVVLGRFAEGAIGVAPGRITAFVTTTAVVKMGVFGRFMKSVPAWRVAGYLDEGDRALFACGAGGSGSDSSDGFGLRAEILVCTPPLSGEQALTLADIAAAEEAYFTSKLAGLDALDAALALDAARASALVDDLVRYLDAGRRSHDARATEVRPPTGEWKLYSPGGALPGVDRLTSAIKGFASHSTWVSPPLPPASPAEDAALLRVRDVLVRNGHQAPALRLMGAALSSPAFAHLCRLRRADPLADVFGGLGREPQADGEGVPGSPTPGADLRVGWDLFGEAMLGYLLATELTAAARRDDAPSPVTRDSPFVLTLDELLEMGVPNAPNSAAHAVERLNAYVGGYLAELDLSRTLVTGSAIAAALIVTEVERTFEPPAPGEHVWPRRVASSDDEGPRTPPAYANGMLPPGFAARARPGADDALSGVDSLGEDSLGDPDVRSSSDEYETLAVRGPVRRLIRDVLAESSSDDAEPPLDDEPRPPSPRRGPLRIPPIERPDPGALATDSSDDEALPPWVASYLAGDGAAPDARLYYPRPVPHPWSTRRDEARGSGFAAYIASFYPAARTVPRDYDKYLWAVRWIDRKQAPFTLHTVAGPDGPVLALTVRDLAGTPVETVMFDVRPGADLDLAIDVATPEEFDAVAAGHFAVIRARYPHAQMRRVEFSEHRYGWAISSADPAETGRFRPVEMYRSTFNHVVTHHVGMVSGAYTARFGPAPEFVVSARLACSMAHLASPNYYYFASRKTTPQHIILKYRARGFAPSAFPPGIANAIEATFSGDREWGGLGRDWETDFLRPALYGKGAWSAYSLPSEFGCAGAGASGAAL